MPDISTIQAQVSSARSQLVERQRSIDEQQRYLASLQTQIPQRKLGYQRDPRYFEQLARHKQEQEFKRQAESRIKEYREKVLKPYEQQIAQAESKIADYQHEQSSFREAERLYEKGFGIKMASSSAAKKYLKLFYRSKSTAQRALEKTGEKQLYAYKDPITGALFSYAPEKAPTSYVPVAISPKGVELPFGEQLRLRAEAPELFEKFEVPVAEEPKIYELAPVTKDIKDILEFGKEIYSPPKKALWETAKAIYGEAYERIPEVEIELVKEKGKKPVPVTEIIGTPEEIEARKHEIIMEETGIRERLEPVFGGEYQTKFEQIYADKIWSEEITFEKAKADFEKSNTAKGINRRYQEAITRERKRLGFTWQEAKVAGISLLGMVPTTYKELAVTALGGAAIIGAFELAPTKLALGYIGYEAVTGVPKVLDPTKVPAERIAAAGEAALAAGILTYAGIKYAKAPVIKTKDIMVTPKLAELEKAAKISPVLKREVFTMAGEEKFIKDFHKMTKLDEQLVTGRRTIVTTKLREKFGLKEVYEGIPYSDPKGYQKAFKKLKKYGLTETEARASLRYSQPRALMLEMQGVAEMVYGAQMPKPEVHVRKAARVTTPDERIIDRALGIKTRKPVRKVEYFAAKGEELAVKEDIEFWKYVTRVEEALLTKAGRPVTPIRKRGKVRTSYEQITGIQPELKIDYLDKASIEILKEATLLKQIIPPKRAIRKARGRIIKYDIEREIPTITYDIEEITGLKVREIPTYRKPPTISKKPLDLKALMKDLEKIYKPKREPKVTKWDLKRHEKRVGELRGYLQDLTAKERANLAKTARDIYGEPAVVTVAPARKPPTAAIAPAIPPIKPVKNIIKDIMKLEQKIMTKSTTRERVRLATGVTARARERFRAATRLDQQMAQITREALKETVRLGITPREAQKVRQEQRLALRQSLLPKKLLRTIVSPPVALPLRPLRPVVTPPFKIPVTPFPSLDISKQVIKGKLRKGKRRRVYAYTPSFTARALGMKPIKVKEPNVEKLLKKMLTGLEVRRPIVVVR